tara:strand:+ start:167 stop:421 length:255 start_codon:yes stop_codon:yes gene_type:complete
MKFINPTEAIKRLAAAQGIDVLNLVRTPEELQQQKNVLMGDKTQMSLVDQAGQLAGTPLMDPQKNPQLADQANQVLQNIAPPQE